MNAVKWVVCALLLAALSGCASSRYPISEELRAQARKVTFDQVKADPNGTMGMVVIWGGRIIDVANTTNGGSIYILCLPVDSKGKPVANGESPGRFIAASPSFLDPELYPHGALVTVAGPLDGVWTEPLEDTYYTYPVLEVQEAHLWPEPQPQASSRVSAGPSWQVYMGPSYWGPSPIWWTYGYPMYRPGFGPGFRGSFHAGVRVAPSRRRR